MVTFKLSDEAIVARWIENPYYQHFTGETFFQPRPPIDPSSLTRWRKRLPEYLPRRVVEMCTDEVLLGRSQGHWRTPQLDPRARCGSLGS